MSPIDVLKTTLLVAGIGVAASGCGAEPATSGWPASWAKAIENQRAAQAANHPTRADTRSQLIMNLRCSLLFRMEHIA
jgi:hypothetical protein